LNHGPGVSLSEIYGDLRCLAAHGDFFFLRSHIQRWRNRSNLAHRNLKVAHFPSLKMGHLNSDGVRRGRNTVDSEITCFVGCGALRYLGAVVRDLHIRAGYESTGSVAQRAVHAAQELTESGQRSETKHRYDH